MCGIWKRSHEKVRLEKKVTTMDRIREFLSKCLLIIKALFNRYKIHLMLACAIVILILLVVLCVMFVPGTESGLWYNKGAI